MLTREPRSPPALRCAQEHRAGAFERASHSQPSKRRVNSRVSCLLFGIPSLQPEFELYFLGDRHHLLTDCAQSS